MTDAGRERNHYGRFEREFTLPEEVDAKQAQAAYRHGMLELVLPLAEEAKPHRIAVKAAPQGTQLHAAGWTARRCVMHSLSQVIDGQNGGEWAANRTCATIRRNGNRFATRAQTRLVAFRRDACTVESASVSPEATRSSEPLRLRMFGKGVLLAFFVALMGMWAAAQSSAPVVTMSVTLPGGRTQEVTAVESGLATISLEDGTEFGFRPTIQDSMPWNRIVVTIFRTATANAPTQILGEVELTRGGPPVDSKTNPSFKVAVPKVSPPTNQTSSTT